VAVAVADQALIPGTEDAAFDWSRMRDHEVDLTPTAVVEQGLRAIAQHFPRGTKHRVVMLDPCAGPGVFGQVARRVFSKIEVVAIEPRREELQFLERNADVVLATTAQAAVVELAGRKFDLIATNPPFREWATILRATLPHLQSWGRLMFLGPSNWGHSDESAELAEVFEEIPPYMQMRVRGRVRFRSARDPDTGKAPQFFMKKLSWWVWRAFPFAQAPYGPGWIAFNLPALDPGARVWTQRPGTET
jgi:hypothetical protein